MTAKKKTKHKRSGQPTKYTKPLGLRICALIAEGLAVHKAVAAQKQKLSTVFGWLVKHPEFSEAYAHARNARAELMFEELKDIADDGRNDWVATNDPDNPGYAFNGEHVNRSRLRVDTYKWMVGKMTPRLADKTAHEITGLNGAAIATTVVAEVVVKPADPLRERLSKHLERLKPPAKQ